ncbi:MAG: SseB family protein [Methanobrevibacter sp.]|jgi:hypothetical protein|uniref:SseB family protein n=1 Tax=Methanobrevibacter sp. TaxID=66852 RepID=UPI0025EDC60F|nr:SseB family protein [Methanobrevibacter sp.]MBE6498510.1 SseB family protein [Methanobrevibacter sp.]
MDNSQIKNKHLGYLLEHVKLYLDDNEKIPLDLLLHLFGELRVSNLLLPLYYEDGDVVFENITSDDGNTYLPIFTTQEEFEKHTDEESPYEAWDHDFDMYLDIVEHSNLDGVVIDIESLAVKLDNEFLSQIPTGTPVKFGDGEALSDKEYKEIFESVTNDELIEFLKSDFSRKDLEPLMVELSNARLLNAVFSDEPLDASARDGIIRCSDVGGFDLFYIDDDPIHLAVLFTSKKEMQESFEGTDLNIYGQVTVLTDLFDFVLKNDMDGIIINPNSLDFYILREEIISQARGFELIAEDDRFKESLEYAFLI